MSGEAVDVGNGHLCLCGYRNDINMENKTVNLQPCKGCQTRTAHCHAKCKSYADYLTELSKFKEKRRSDSILAEYVRSARWRKKRRR